MFQFISTTLNLREIIFIFLTHSVNGWYNLKGLPITLLVKTDSAPESSFIEYTYATEGEEESYSFVTQIKQSTKSIFIPIIKLDQLPDFMV